MMMKNGMRFWLLPVCCCLIFTATHLYAAEENTPGANARQSPFKAAQYMGGIENSRLTECSGMDISLSTPDLLWAVNDSGNRPFLYALGINGRNLGRVKVNGASNRDWEGLETFFWEKQPMILIADIGDNKARHDLHTLYMVREPQLSGKRFAESAMVDVAWKVIFSYPDGNHDAESIAVDASGSRIFVITKREHPPCLYSLPLKPATGDRPVVAEKITQIRLIPPPSEEDLKHKYGIFRSQPTALDISMDGLTAVVLTYKDAYLFTRSSSGSWKEAFGKEPRIVQLPLPQDRKDLKQREALCLSSDGRVIYVTSEGRGAGIYRLDAR